MGRKSTGRTVTKSKSKPYSLSQISSAGKKVAVKSSATKSSNKRTGVLYSKMLNQESDDMKRLSKWYTEKKPNKATSSKGSKKVHRISGFKKTKDGSVVAVKK